jgi:hypothetical protein
LFRRIGNFTGRFIIITFFTDSSIVRQGFDLTWEAIGPSDHTRTLDNEQISHVPLKFSQTMSLPFDIKSKGEGGFQLYAMSGREISGIRLNLTSRSAPRNVREFCKRATTQLFTSHGGHVSPTGTESSGLISQ